MVVCIHESAVDHSIYLERMKQKLLNTSTCPKTPCGPVTARDASFQTHLNRVAAIKNGLNNNSVSNPTSPTARADSQSTPACCCTNTNPPIQACCTNVVPHIFHYDDCWYIQHQATAWSRFYN